MPLLIKRIVRMNYPLVKKKYRYPEAGKNAHPEVQKLIEEYRALPNAEKSKKPLLYWLLGSGTPPYKMSKDDSEYSDEADTDSQCGNCKFIYYGLETKNYICSQISGPIRKEGTCKLWKPGRE